ncbi:MAG: MFS transporter [Pseudomonadota bacterium]|nr:MFS transporter [Pseudomonadota bacterium]
MTAEPSQGFERANWRGLVAVIASSLIIGVGLGGATPLLSLKMEAWSVPSLIIGLNAAMGPLGVITGSFLVPRFLRHFSGAACIAAGILWGGGVLLLFGLTDDLPAWFALRFLFGLTLALPWVVGEAWINAVATDAVRGRVMAYYATALAGGFMLGPLVLTVIGSQGLAPFVFIAGTVAISAGPIWWVRRLAPDLRVDHRVGAFSMIWVAPTIFVTAAAQGALDGGIFSFLPIYGLRHGLDESTAALALAAFMAGNVVLQIPLGLMLDRVNRRLMLLVAAGLMTVLPLLIPVVFGQWWLLMAVLFVWGGMVWGSYTIALAMMGDRFKTGQITLANATFIVVMEIANLAGPPIAGVAIDTADGQGLIGFFVLFSGVLFTVVALRGLRRGDLVS